MDYSFNRSKVFKFFAGVLGLLFSGYLLYYMTRILSPFTYSVIYGMLFVGAIVTGLYREGGIIRKVSFSLSGVFYVLILVHWFSSFEVPKMYGNLFLLVSLGALMVVHRYVKKGFGLSYGTVRGLVTVLLIIVVGLALFDILGAETTVRADMNEGASIESGSETLVANVDVENEFMFPRHVDTYMGCMYDPEFERNVLLGFTFESVEDESSNMDIISSGVVKEYRMMGRITEGDGRQKITLEDTSFKTAKRCPSEHDERTLFLIPIKGYRSKVVFEN